MIGRCISQSELAQRWQRSAHSWRSRPACRSHAQDRPAAEIDRSTALRSTVQRSVRLRPRQKFWYGPTISSLIVLLSRTR